MKIAILIIAFLFAASPLLADRVDIPFTCYPKQIQEKFRSHGKKLDLSANDRDDNSWAFIESRGNSYSIYTYSPLNLPEDLNEIQKIISEK